ncbi:MAG: orotidine-5'-phosphate decarboxylase [Alphaproteobacteria bacterium]
MERTGPDNPVFCALDTPDLGAARVLASRLKGSVGGLKLGLEFFVAFGPAGVGAVAREGLPIFLDLKFHDIPNTVAGAVGAAVALGPAFLTIHAAGGREMMRRAAEAAANAAQRQGVPRPRLVGVTVLTSLGPDDMGEIGFAKTPADQVLKLAALAQDAGLDGVVCSAHEIAAVRKECGADFTLVVPGIRPSSTSADDQKRVMGPAEAMRRGADYLVIGRPITAAADPAEAARRIMAEIAGG